MMKESSYNRGVDSILKYIKNNTVGAEIGVWKGDTSSKFLAKKIKELHLVDSWSVDPYIKNDGERCSNLEHWMLKYEDTVGIQLEDFTVFYEDIYNSVVERFKDEPRAKIFRCTSEEYFNNFSGRELDWIYIDGDHSYDGVYFDLKSSLQVIKKDGMIFGDDFDKKGVQEAVRNFIKEFDLPPLQKVAKQYIIDLK